MSLWLFKQEPGCYSFADLKRDGKTLWDGVTNPLALKHLRSVRKGDRIFFYHTGNDKAVVGSMIATSDAAPVEGDETGKLVAVTVKAEKALTRPVTLAQIKSEEMFSQWELVRNSRLSVMPVSQEIWDRVLEISEESEA